jgi:hypothetical protein
MAEGPPYKSFADVPKGTPTPTQDELNRMASGETVECAPDGTPADTTNQPVQGSIYGVKPSPTPAAHASAHHTSRSATGGGASSRST